MNWTNFFGFFIGILGTMIIMALEIDSKYLVIGMIVGIVIYQIIKYIIVNKDIAR